MRQRGSRPTNERERLGRHIRAARTKAGLTARALAKAVGVTPSSVCEWEKGRSTPTTANLAKIAEVTGESASFLLSDRLHGRETLESVCRELGGLLGYRRARALLDVPEARLRREVDAILGSHLVESSPTPRRATKRK